MEATPHEQQPQNRVHRVLEDSVLPALQAPGYPGWLLLGVLGVIAYAAFANGATAVEEESRVQIALAGGLIGCGIGVAIGELGAARSRLGWGAVGLLAAFAVFCALSEGWSIAPDESWTAANRAAEYAALLTIVLIVAPSVPRAPEWALGGFLVIALGVALYALGGKIAPTVSLGPIDLDHASQFSRLRAPLGYWNALGMLLVMAIPACLWLVSDPERAPGQRIVTLLGLEILLVTIALTYSRGALIAIAVAVGVMAVFGEQRARTAIAAFLALLAAAAPVAFAFSRDKLSADGIAAADRTGDGLVLGLILTGSLLMLAGVLVYLMRLEEEWEFPYASPAEMRRFLAVSTAVIAAIVVVALSLSPRGLTGAVSHEWDRFRQPSGISNDPGRLLSSNGSSRWIWWREAVGAFSDKPLNGQGAGSFPIIHNEYREHVTQVRSAHNVPLQFLGEGGLIGATLALGGVGLLFAAAVRTTRDPDVEDRGARIALIAAGTAWGVHCLIDWDWEIPAVTLPALAALGLAAAPWGEGRRWLDPNPPRDRRRRLNEVLAAPAGAVLAVVAIGFGYSAELPAMAESKRLHALTSVGEAEPGDQAVLAAAIAEAESAHDLNPLDEDAAFTVASLLQTGGDYEGAREILVEAARTQPENYRVWDALLDFAQATGDGVLAATAFQRRLETEPLSFAQDPNKGAGDAWELAVPAELSPTAYGAPPAKIAPAVPGAQPSPGDTP